MSNEQSNLTTHTTKGTFETLPQMIRTAFNDGTTVEGPADLPTTAIKSWFGEVVDGFCKITGACGGGGGGVKTEGCTSVSGTGTAADGSTVTVTVKSCPPGKA